MIPCRCAVLLTNDDNIHYGMFAISDKYAILDGKLLLTKNVRDWKIVDNEEKKYIYK